MSAAPQPHRLPLFGGAFLAMPCFDVWRVPHFGVPWQPSRPEAIDYTTPIRITYSQAWRILVRFPGHAPARAPFACFPGKGCPVWLSKHAANEFQIPCATVEQCWVPPAMHAGLSPLKLLGSSAHLSSVWFCVALFGFSMLFIVFHALPMLCHALLSCIESFWIFIIFWYFLLDIFHFRLNCDAYVNIV